MARSAQPHPLYTSAFTSDIVGRRPRCPAQPVFGQRASAGTLPRRGRCLPKAPARCAATAVSAAGLYWASRQATTPSRCSLGVPADAHGPGFPLSAPLQDVSRPGFTGSGPPLPEARGVGFGRLGRVFAFDRGENRSILVGFSAVWCCRVAPVTRAGGRMLSWDSRFSAGQCVFAPTGLTMSRSLPLGVARRLCQCLQGCCSSVGRVRPW